MIPRALLFLISTDCSPDRGPVRSNPQNTVPPEVLSIMPPDGTTGTGLLQPITVAFSEATGPDSLNAHTLTLRLSGATDLAGNRLAPAARI